MIDTAAIRRAASGDKTKKVAVTKAWLIAVADEIDKNRKDDIISQLFRGYHRK